MRINRRVAIVLVVVAAALGSVLGFTFDRASGDRAPQYEVTVRFNTSVTQGDLDEAFALLRSYDQDVEFLIMESFPPIGGAVLETDAAEFCGTIEAELEAKSYVESASCQPWQERDGGNPDTPVTTTAE